MRLMKRSTFRELTSHFPLLFQIEEIIIVFTCQTIGSLTKYPKNDAIIISEIWLVLE